MPLATTDARLRRIASGSMGWAARASHARNPATRATPAPMATRTWGSVQPSALPWVAPHTIPTRPAPARATPGRSSERSGPRLSRSRREARTTATMPIGTLSQKIQCHERPWVIAPPTTGPRAIARPEMPPQAPSASGRRAGETASERMVRLSGVTNAAPIPCAARARISISLLGARAAAAEPRVKMPRPIVNMRRRPKRSPSAAPEQEQGGVGEGVGVDGPLEVGDGRPRARGG